MKNSTKIILGVVALVVVGVLIATYFYSNSAKSINTTEFYSKAGIVLFNAQTPDDVSGENYSYVDPDLRFAVALTGNEQIYKVVVATYNLKGYIMVNNKEKLAYTCSFARSEIDWAKLEALAASGVTISHEDPNSGSVWSSLVMPILSIGLGLLILIVFLRQMNASNRSAFDY